MSNTDKATSRTPAESDKSTTDGSTADTASMEEFAENTAVHTDDGKRIKGVEGHAPSPDDQPKREDEDLSALLQNPNANQKPN